MKQLSVFLLLGLLNIFPCFSQDDIAQGVSDAIRQISTSGIDNILSFQNMNRGNGGFVLMRQTGDQNTARLNQKSDAGPSNQSYTFQQGNLNELSVGQIGSGNLLLSFQLGYLAYGVNNISGIQPFVALLGENGILAKGEHNNLKVTQNGENNGIKAVQQGDYNLISAEQNGTNNYLLISQKGTHNTVTGYKQENYSPARNFDTIIQEGDDLSLEATGVSNSKTKGNIFSQSGSELALQVNNGFVNTLGGIAVTQTGTKMTVVVDQSFFP